MALSIGIPALDSSGTALPIDGRLIDVPQPGYHDRAVVELQGLLDDLEREAAPLRDRLEELGMQRERLSTALEAFGAVERSSETIENAEAAFAVARAQRAQDELPQPAERPDVQTRHRRQESPLGRPDYRPRPPQSTTAQRVERVAKVLALIRESPGPVAMHTISAAMGVGRSTLKNDISLLLKTGSIQSIRVGKGVVYSTTAALDAEVAATNGKDSSRFCNRHVEKVGNAISSARINGVVRGLTEMELVEWLGMDREDVALACGTLLEDGRVTLGPSGTYRWATIGGMDGDRAADSGAGESERGALPAGKVEG